MTLKLKSKNKNLGFTLIELLVVVSLIGVLATLVLSNLNAARERGRDAQRKADMRNLQTALRIYYNDCGKYPINQSSNIAGCGTCGTPSLCPWGSAFETNLAVYMKKLPSDPLPDGYYVYTQIDSDDYTLESCLENLSDEDGVDDQTATWCSTKWVYAVTP